MSISQDRIFHILTRHRNLCIEGWLIKNLNGMQGAFKAYWDVLLPKDKKVCCLVCVQRYLTHSLDLAVLEACERGGECLVLFTRVFSDKSDRKLVLPRLPERN